MGKSTISAPVWRIKDGQVLETIHKDVPYDYFTVDEEGVITADPATAQQLLYAYSKIMVTTEQAINALMVETMGTDPFGEGDGYGDAPF